MLIDWMLVCVKCILVHPLICGLICSLCKDTVCIKIRYIDKICFHASSVWMGCDQNLSRCLLIRFGSHDDFLHGFTCDKGVCFLFMYVFIFNFEVITSFNVIKGHERKKVLSIKLAWWVKKKIKSINDWLHWQHNMMLVWITEKDVEEVDIFSSASVTKLHTIHTGERFHSSVVTLECTTMLWFPNASVVCNMSRFEMNQQLFLVFWRCYQTLICKPSPLFSNILIFAEFWL